MSLNGVVLNLLSTRATAPSRLQSNIATQGSLQLACSLYWRCRYLEATLLTAFC